MQSQVARPPGTPHSYLSFTRSRRSERSYPPAQCLFPCPEEGMMCFFPHFHHGRCWRVWSISSGSRILQIPSSRAPSFYRHSKKTTCTRNQRMGPKVHLCRYRDAFWNYSCSQLPRHRVAVVCFSCSSHLSISETFNFRSIGCITVANIIRGKSANEISKMFNISSFTPEEEAQIDKEKVCCCFYHPSVAPYSCFFFSSRSGQRIDSIDPPFCLCLPAACCPWFIWILAVVCRKIRPIRTKLIKICTFRGETFISPQWNIIILYMLHQEITHPLFDTFAWISPPKNSHGPSKVSQNGISFLKHHKMLKMHTISIVITRIWTTVFVRI